MSSKLESGVCCRLQVSPSGESCECKRRPGRKQWQTPGLWRELLHVTCGLAACTPGSAPGPTLSNEYGKTLPLTLPYSITERGVPELIPVLGSQPAGDVSHKHDGRLPLLSARPAVTPATLKTAATNFAAW